MADEVGNLGELFEEDQVALVRCAFHSQWLKSARTHQEYGDDGKQEFILGLNSTPQRSKPVPWTIEGDSEQ